MLNEYLAFYYTCQRICHYYNQQQFSSLLQLLDETQFEEYNTDQFISLLRQLRQQYVILNYCGNGHFRLFGQDDWNFKDFTLQYNLSHKQTICQVAIRFEDEVIHRRLNQLLKRTFTSKTELLFHPVQSSNSLL